MRWRRVYDRLVYDDVDDSYDQNSFSIKDLFSIPLRPLVDSKVLPERNKKRSSVVVVMKTEHEVEK